MVATMLRRSLVVATTLVVAACTGTSPEPTATTAASATTVAPVVTVERPDPTSPDGMAVVPSGFDRAAALVVTADGTECELCLWVAATDAQRRRGLMEVTDLGGADGMVFVYATPRTGTFWMKDTLLPLSIAFFDLGGDHLGEFDMEPCTDDPCPSYPTPADFTYAIEVERGRLADLGVGPGSTFRLLGAPCTD